MRNILRQTVRAVFHATVAAASAVRRHLWGVTVAAVVAIHLLHLVALPISMSYDGHIYVQMADLFGTDRFAQEWHPARTPLYPLLLRTSFLLTGRNALSPLLLQTAMALTGILVLGAVVRRRFGVPAASLGMLVASLFPGSIAYQHMMLTETGVFFFVALILALLLVEPESPGARWRRVLGLILLLAAGYYFRQTILPLAWPVALILFAEGVAEVRRRHASEGRASSWFSSWRHYLLPAGQAALIVVLPYLAAKPWSGYCQDDNLTDAVLHQGLFRQCLLPFDHPAVGPYSDDYRRAVEASLHNGHLYAGMRGVLVGELRAKTAPYMKDGPRKLFLDCVRSRPGRYLRGMARTAIYFCGAKGVESEVSNSQYCTMCPAWLAGYNKIPESGTPNYAANLRDFTQKTSGSAVMRGIWNLIPVYDYVLPAVMIVTVLGLLGGLVFRDLTLLSLCLIPLAVMVPYVIVLNPIDRYVLPAQITAMCVVGAVVVCLSRAWRQWRFRRRVPESR